MVKFDDFQEYFHWSELEIVTEAESFAHYTTVEELTDEEYLDEPEESDIELEATLLDKAIDTLIHGNWESIRDLFNQHPEIKEEAWNVLSSEQKRRVVDITLETVKVLYQAKKEGVIEEYRFFGRREASRTIEECLLLPLCNKSKANSPKMKNLQ